MTTPSAIRALIAASTPGPWTAAEHQFSYGSVWTMSSPNVAENGMPSEGDIKLWCAAQALLPLLCDVLEAAEKRCGWGHDDECPTKQGSTNCVCGHAALRAAVDAVGKVKI